MSSKSLFKSIQNREGTRIESSEEDVFNLTHLSPMKEWARNRCLHRDMNSHNLRWQYVSNYVFKNFKRDTCTILDVGCAPDWNLLVTIHSNGAHPGYYMGIDARDCSRTIPKVSFPTVFEQVNIVDRLPMGPENDCWNLITFLEVLEHMPKDCGIKVLNNLFNIMDQNSTLIMSTPCYDEKAGMAESHIREWTYSELKEELEVRFTIEDHFGTFISQSSYVSTMSEEELKMFHRLKQYFNSAWISNFYAPLYPDKSRNCLWVLKKKI